MEIIYQDVDITKNSTPLIRCELDQYLSDHIDTMTVIFDNNEGSWTNWAPKVGDKIRCKEEYCDSGNMYIHSIEPCENTMVLKAASLKYIKSGHTHTWEDIHFKQLIDQRASDLGLKVEYLGVTDQEYGAVEQDGSDLSFINELCKLEGCGFMITDGVMRVISYDYMEKLPVSSYTINALKHRSHDMPYYTGCMVTDGKTYGKAGDESGEIVKLDTPHEIASIAEANRFAENALKYANFKRKYGEIYADTLLSTIRPGSKVTLKSDYWNKPIIVTHTRHELRSMKSKIFFRLCREE